MIRLTESQWIPLHHRLAQDYRHRPSVLMIRDAMRREIGCTVRRHRQWQDTRNQEQKQSQDILDWPFTTLNSGHMQEWICLDFYDPARETWFQLKYAEYLENV